MMHKDKGKIDIIDKVLTACYEDSSYPLFIMSLMHQYEERGSLSKKQLQGLCDKAKKVTGMPPNWITTLEAVILKMPTRYKSAVTIPAPELVKNEHVGKLIENILTKYPQHKRALFLRSKYNNNELLTVTEVAELEKFNKILLA